MKKISLKFSSLIIATLMVFSLGTLVVFATDSSSGLLPDVFKTLMNLLGPAGVCSSTYIQSRVQMLLVLALGLVVLIAVVYALIAAFKYISSQGESGKMEEAQKSIKAIFIGIAAMFIAIIGIVLVFAVFGAQQTNPDLFQTCINEPNSVACRSCRNGGASDPACKACEEAITKYCQSGASTTDEGLTWAKLKIKDTGIGAACK